jgi:hypothetical protein
LFFFVLFLSVVLPPPTPVKENALNASGPGYSVALTTHSWTVLNSTNTAIPATSPCTSRDGMFVNNPESNSGTVNLTCSKTAPTEGITVAPFKAKVGADRWIPCGPALNIYGVSLHTGPESVNVKEACQ